MEPGNTKLVLDPALFREIQLETDRLLIRPYRSSDADSLIHLMRDDDMYRYIPEDPMSAEKIRGIVEMFVRRYQEGCGEDLERYSLAVTSRPSGELLGWVGLGQVDFEPEHIEIYYGIGKDDWGKGYAGEAARALLRYGFETVGLDPIVALAIPENVASVRVLEKLQMDFLRIVEGLTGEFEFFNGCRYYTLSRRDYEKRVATLTP